MTENISDFRMFPAPNQPLEINLRRAALVAEARSWIGTKYHLGAHIKGAGCDCATLLVECAVACGLAEREELGVYSHDWFCHTKEERYLLRALRHTKSIMEAVAYRSTRIEPGNYVLTKVGSKIYNHGGIVTAWPKIIHAVHPAVEEIDASRHPMWSMHEIVVFDLIQKTLIEKAV